MPGRWNVDIHVDIDVCFDVDIDVCFRMLCRSDSGLCPELSPGSWAAGHRVDGGILPGLGLVDEELRRQDLGEDPSGPKPPQQKLVLDKMVRNMMPFKCCPSPPLKI